MQHASQRDVRFAFAVLLLLLCPRASSSFSSHRPPPVWVDLNHSPRNHQNSNQPMSNFSLLSNRLCPGTLISGHNRSRSLCFQVQPDTCLILSVSLCVFGSNSIRFMYKVMGNLPEALNFNQLFLKLNGFIRN